MTVKKQIVRLSDNQVTHAGVFETEELAQAWISQMESKPVNPWGKLERLTPTSECTVEELALALETISEVTEEIEGETVVVTPEMKRLPKTYRIDDVSETHNAEMEKQRKIELGKLDRAKCETALDLIAGYNRDRVLTMEQITQMQSTFANVEAALRANRPDYAKSFITAITPDGVLVTQAMKDDILSVL